MADLRRWAGGPVGAGPFRFGPDVLGPGHPPPPELATWGLDLDALAELSDEELEAVVERIPPEHREAALEALGLAAARAWQSAGEPTGPEARALLEDAGAAAFLTVEQRRAVGLDRPAPPPRCTRQICERNGGRAPSGRFLRCVWCN